MVILSYLVKFNFVQSLVVYLATNIFQLYILNYPFYNFFLYNTLNICYILVLSFTNKENIYLKLLLLFTYFFKIGLNCFLVYFIKNINANNILYLGDLWLNMKYILYDKSYLFNPFQF